MKTILETIAVAFSMFSALPMPRIEWNEKNMRCCMAAFPMVGIVTGLLEAVWIIVCDRIGWSSVLLAAGAVAIPILVSGGIHMDGYMDVSDALSSYGDAQKRRDILADPHIGAFAVIKISVLLILTFGLASQLSADRVQLVLFGCSFVLSRSLSGLAVAVLPLSGSTGLAHTFQSTADRKTVTWLLMGWTVLISVAMLAAGSILSGIKGLAAAVLMICAAVLQWMNLRHTSSVKFGGLSGDLNGWFLQKAEFWMLAFLVLTEGLVK